jgi:hypothetical protein
MSDDIREHSRGALYTNVVPDLDVISAFSHNGEEEK